MSEVSWFLANYGLLNLYVFVLAIGQGLWLMSSFNGAIPGWTGSPIEQLVMYALAVVLYTSVVLGFPVLVVGLVAWRALIRVVGNPRSSAAVVIVGMTASVTAFLGQTTRPEHVVLGLLLAMPFAAVLRLPRTSTQSGLPTRLSTGARRRL
jgi:hypothetical protein